MQGINAALAILALYPGRLKPAPPPPATCARACTESCVAVEYRRNKHAQLHATLRRSQQELEELQKVWAPLQRRMRETRYLCRRTLRRSRSPPVPNPHVPAAREADGLPRLRTLSRSSAAPLLQPELAGGLEGAGLPCPYRGGAECRVQAEHASNGEAL